MGFSTGVIGRLAAHVGVFHLYTEQRAVCAHAQLVPLQTLIKVHVSRRIRDACSVKHDGPVEDDAVLLEGDEAEASECRVCFTLPTPTIAHKALFTGEVKFLTYSPELDVSTHFELHSSAHNVDAFVSTNDGFAVALNVEVGRSAACDLRVH